MQPSTTFHLGHRRRIWTLAAFFVAICLGVSGCAVYETEANLEPTSPALADDPGDRWDGPFGRMGVVPVLPPSEDVRVGDIFVYPFNPDIRDTRYGPGQRGGFTASPRWATLNLLEELEAEYQIRPAWPATPDNFLQSSADPAEREWSEASAGQEQGIFARDSVPQRLRSFGIPEFSTFTLTEGDVNALLPTEAINLVFGSAWSDRKALSIRMNSAETYSLGLQQVIEAALGDTELGSELRAPYRDHLALIADAASDSVWVRILSDVVYVRSIDIIIQSTSAFEADEDTNASEFVAELEETLTVVEELSGDMAVASEGAGDEAGDEVVDAAGPEPDQQVGEAQRQEGEAERQSDDAVTEVVTVTETEMIPDNVLDPAYAAFVRARAINELLVETNADVLPGGFLRFVSITDDSITVRRVWQRGLAVGARGMTLEVDKVTGAVLRAGNMGSMVP